MFEALGFSRGADCTSASVLWSTHFATARLPHAGFAFGLDRLVMQLTRADVAAGCHRVPQAQGRLLPHDRCAPDTVDEEQLEVLGMGWPGTKEAGCAAPKRRTNQSGIDVSACGGACQAEHSPAGGAGTHAKATCWTWCCLCRSAGRDGHHGRGTHGAHRASLCRTSGARTCRCARPAIGSCCWKTHRHKQDGYTHRAHRWLSKEGASHERFTELTV